MRRFEYLGLVVLLLAGCSKSDDQANVVPAPAVVTGQPPTNNPPPNPPPASTSLAIYTDDLQQGGTFLYPSGENQTLAFNDTSNPTNGANSMKYAWNGGDVGSQHGFAGVDLIHATDFNDYKTTPGKDIRSGNYTKVTFNARGGLSADTVVMIEVADEGSLATPAPCLVLSADGLQDDSTPGNPNPRCLNKANFSNTWQSYSISVSANDLASVKDYFKATFIYKGSGTGSGGTLFVDQILYTP